MSSSATGPAAVLFDMDGLLVTTEETWLAVEHDIMERLDGHWGPEHQAALVGGPLQVTAQYMLDHAGRPDVGRSTVEAWLLDGMAQRLRAEPVRWMPGARELLEALRAEGVPCGLVSASYRRLVDAVLTAVGPERFAVTVAGDEVHRNKPHPDPYLLAAARLGVDPGACVVLEDSAFGAMAAEAAGCITVVVPSVVAVPAGPDRLVVGSLRDLDVAALRRLAARRPGAVDRCTAQAADRP